MKQIENYNDIPDDDDGSDGNNTNKEEYYWQFMHLKGTLQFIQYYRPLCDTDNTTKF